MYFYFIAIDNLQYTLCHFTRKSTFVFTLVDLFCHSYSRVIFRNVHPIFYDNSNFSSNPAKMIHMCVCRKEIDTSITFAFVIHFKVFDT